MVAINRGLPISGYALELDGRLKALPPGASGSGRRRAGAAPLDAARENLRRPDKGERRGHC